MDSVITRVVGAVASVVVWAAVAATAARAEEPLVVVGARVAGEGVPVAQGVRHVEVYRAREGGWTYNHHVDMAVWRGRLYVGWDQCEKDEDVGVSRELYATSADGVTWLEPRLLFPQGVSAALRMYFFVAPNGRMLAVARLRTSADTAAEVKRSGVVVREVRGDHSLGEVYTLIRPITEAGAGVDEAKMPAFYETAGDAGLVEACGQLLANRPFLEQEDYGRLLGERRMRWHDLGQWAADEPSREHFPRFGKGMSFYHRKDGALVGLMKWGWVTVSRDEGVTWTQPARPASLVAGMAKVWGQRTPNGKYVLFYNPDLEKRYPLVMVSGEDGVTFGGMKVVRGDVPPIRYPGLYKVEGPQYVRGVSEWSTDGTWKDDGAVWVTYSVGKEDIWVSRVEVP